MLNNVRSPKSRLCDDLDGTYIWYYDHYRICWINTFCFSVTFYLFLSRLRRHRKQTAKNQVETKQYVLWWVPALHLESVLSSMHWSIWYLLYIIVLDVFTGTVYVTICFLYTIYMYFCTKGTLQQQVFGPTYLTRTVKFPDILRSYLGSYCISRMFYTSVFVAFPGSFLCHYTKIKCQTCTSIYNLHILTISQSTSIGVCPM